MSNALTEKETEQYALDLLLNVGWDYVSGDKIERSSLGEVVLTERLRSALAKLNPHIPAEAREQVMEQVIRLSGTDVTNANRQFHEWMTEKVGIPYQEGGDEKSHLITLIDFDNPERNDFLAVNQFTIIGDKNNDRRPDIILFVNGLPLVVIELKNPVVYRN